MALRSRARLETSASSGLLVQPRRECDTATCAFVIAPQSVLHVFVDTVDVDLHRRRAVPTRAKSDSATTVTAIAVTQGDHHEYGLRTAKHRSGARCVRGRIQLAGSL